MAKYLDYGTYCDMEELVEELHSHKFRVEFSLVLENIEKLTKKIKESKGFDDLKGYDKDFIRNLYTKSNALRDMLVQREYDINRNTKEIDAPYDTTKMVQNEDCILDLYEYNRQLQFPDEEDKTLK